MFKVLYNDCYGSFHLSDEFEAEYERRAGKKISTLQYVPCGTNTIRVDPIAVALFEERGSLWSSAPHASIKLHMIPAVFANYWTIDEYEGDETVSVSVEGALADVLETYIQTGDHAAMLDQYRRIKVAQGQLARSFKEDLTA